mmetsp:Transcript_40099/g.100704  ORF Transcript_40099/g.100704 Transcript_40099/m.100704 type:complete len:463 (+) Transcript_40099:208-1596(+)
MQSFHEELLRYAVPLPEDLEEPPQRLQAQLLADLRHRELQRAALQQLLDARQAILLVGGGLHDELERLSVLELAEEKVQLFFPPLCRALLLDDLVLLLVRLRVQAAQPPLALGAALLRRLLGGRRGAVLRIGFCCSGTGPQLPQLPLPVVQADREGLAIRPPGGARGRAREPEGPHVLQPRRAEHLREPVERRREHHRGGAVEAHGGDGLGVGVGQGLDELASGGQVPELHLRAARRGEERAARESGAGLHWVPVVHARHARRGRVRAEAQIPELDLAVVARGDPHVRASGPRRQHLHAIRVRVDGLQQLARGHVPDPQLAVAAACRCPRSIRCCKSTTSHGVPVPPQPSKHLLRLRLHHGAGAAGLTSEHELAIAAPRHALSEVLELGHGGGGFRVAVLARLPKANLGAADHGQAVRLGRAESQVEDPGSLLLLPLRPEALVVLGLGRELSEAAWLWQRAD